MWQWLPCCGRCSPRGVRRSSPFLARAPRRTPRGGADLRARRASSDTLLATACSWTCRATIPTLRLHIIKDPTTIYCNRITLKTGDYRGLRNISQPQQVHCTQAHRHGRWRRGRGRNVWCSRLREQHAAPGVGEGPDQVEQGHFRDTLALTSLFKGGITGGPSAGLQDMNETVNRNVCLTPWFGAE